MIKTGGLQDPEKIAEAADQMATQFIRRNVTKVSLGRDDYLMPRATTMSIGFDKGQWENVSEIWKVNRKTIAQDLGVSRSELGLDLSSAQKINGKVRIPVTFLGFSGFAKDSAVSFIEVPLDRVELKKASEFNSKPIAVPQGYPVDKEVRDWTTNFMKMKGSNP